MRTSFLILAAILTGGLSSCSPDGDNNNTNPATDTAYFSVKHGSYWTYNVPGNATTLAAKDSLYVANDTLINTITYKKFKTKDQPVGFYSNSLNGNSLRKDGDKILLTGAASLNINALLPVNLDVTDFVIFKESAQDGEQLSSLSGTMSQTIPGLETYPLTINYTLKSSAVNSLATFTSPSGTVYNDVKAVKTILNMNVTTTPPGFPQAATLMPQQDVLTSTQYYAKNIGVVYAHTVISYHLNDFSAIGLTLPIPQTGSQTQEEMLATYHIE